ncbi:probable 28S ribosomal protein S16, mitochondrial [Argonauta hians]
MGRKIQMKKLLRTGLIIRFASYGCTNRPFFHIVAIPQRNAREGKCVEQLGTYDPMANRFGESLVSVNFSRLKYYMAGGALFTKPVAELLGLSGFLPIHPRSIMLADREQKKVLEEEKNGAPKDSAEA